MADLRHISRALSQYGRNGDQHLVHMSSRELAALQKLSPKGLTRNPHTGLPEAFNLGDILGPVAGIATAIFAPEMLPWVAGADALGTGIASGNIGQGIMAGLGTYGAGSLAGAIGGATGLFGDAGSSGGILGNLFGSGSGTAAQTTTPLSVDLGSAGSAAAAPGSVGIGGGLTSTATQTATAQPMAALAQAANQSPNEWDVGIPGAASGLSAPAINPSLGTLNASTPSLAGAGGSSGGAGGITSFIKNNPWAIPAGLMAVSALSPNGSGNVPSQLNQQPSTPPMVQGPVANPATWPSSYTPGGPEQSFFPQNSAVVNPASTLSMSSPVYAAQAQALQAIQSPTYSLSQAAQRAAGAGSPEQQAAIYLQAQQQQQLANAMGYNQSFAKGGMVPRPQSDFGGMPFPMRNYDTGTKMPDFGGYMGGMSGGGLKSLRPKRMADGGPASGAGDQEMEQNLIAEAKAAIIGKSDNPDEALQRFVQYFGPDALKQLSQQVTGASGPVHGAGDGTADMVPGTIDGTEPVQLATDEHVIPADVVSGLGNGSSTQGHRLLKEMTARVRSAKTGHSRMPARVKASEMLPG